MRRWLRAAAPLALIALVGCTSTVSGTGTLGAGLGSSASPGAGGGSAPPTSFPTGTNTPRPTTSRLADLLVDPPAGAQPWRSAWARDRTPTVQEFVTAAYPKQYVDLEVTLLRAQGLRHIAHVTWLAPDDDQADMVLLQFGSESGARARYRMATSAKAHSPGIRQFVVPGTPRAVGFYHPTVDRLGNVIAVVYSRVGSVVVEEFYYSPRQIRTADAKTWMRAQLDLLD